MWVAGQQLCYCFSVITYMRSGKFLLIISICLLNYGCAIFHSDYLETDNDGHYVNHFHSCGPKALRKALNKLNIKVYEKQLSKEIQSSGNLTRTLLTLIHYETVQVTLPSEMKKACLDYGYEVEKVKNLKELDPKKDIAIVLVTGNVLKGETHWVCFPVDTNITNYFGKNTKIKKIYLLKKK